MPVESNTTFCFQVALPARAASNSIVIMVPEPTHIDEPQIAKGYADVLSEVASKRQPVIVRRAGEDLAAVIPLE